MLPQMTGAGSVRRLLDSRVIRAQPRNCGDYSWTESDQKQKRRVPPALRLLAARDINGTLALRADGIEENDPRGQSHDPGQGHHNEMAERILHRAPVRRLPREQSAPRERSDRRGNVLRALLLLLLALQQEALRKVLPLGQFLNLSLNGIQSIESVRSDGRGLGLTLGSREPMSVNHPARAQDEPEHGQCDDRQSGKPRGIDGHPRFPPPKTGTQTGAAQRIALKLRRGEERFIP